MPDLRVREGHECPYGLDCQCIACLCVFADGACKREEGLIAGIDSLATISLRSSAIFKSRLPPAFMEPVPEDHVMGAIIRLPPSYDLLLAWCIWLRYILVGTLFPRFYYFGVGILYGVLKWSLKH